MALCAQGPAQAGLEDVCRPPVCCHPNRPVIVWAAGRFLFALNLETGQYETWRSSEQERSIVSIDFLEDGSCKEGSTQGGLYAHWVVANDDKSVVAYEDCSFRMTHRFLLRKRASSVRVCEHGGGLIWGDKFGDVFKLSIGEAETLTRRVVSQYRAHFRRNIKDSAALRECQDVLRRFCPQALETIQQLIERKAVEKISSAEGQHPALGRSLSGAPVSVPGHALNRDEEEMENEDEDEYCFAPFAGHMAAVTTLELSADRRYLASGDRDEKIRIGTVASPHTTVGYCLGHIEFVTALRFLSRGFGADNDAPLWLASGSGDHTVRLWAIIPKGSSIPDTSCVEVDVFRCPAVPTHLAFCQKSQTLVVLCHGMSGVYVVPLVNDGTEDAKKTGYAELQHEDTTSTTSAHNTRSTSGAPAGCTAAFSEARWIALPAPPVSIAVVELPPLDTIRTWGAFASPNLAPNAGILKDSEPILALFWVDGEGRLRMPWGIEAGAPVFKICEEESGDAAQVDASERHKPLYEPWVGCETGDAIAPMPEHLWKHTRVPGAPTESEHRRKRLRRPHKAESPTNTPSACGAT